MPPVRLATTRAWSSSVVRTASAPNRVIVVTLVIFLNIARSSCQSCLDRPQPNPPLFSDFSNSSTSATGSIPSAGSCNTYGITITSSCSAPNSTLLLEFWLTDSSFKPLDRRRTVSGIYFLAAANSPEKGRITTNSQGGMSFVVGAVSDSLKYDSEAMINARTYQRFTVPVGDLFDHLPPAVTALQWYLTLANVNTQLIVGSFGYTFRATCMLAQQLPCPRTGPDVGDCNTPWPYTSSQCVASPSGGVKSCKCQAGQYDAACGTPVMDLSNSPSFFNVFAPTSTWSYFSVTFPTIQDIKLLSELIKPPLAANTYYASVVTGSTLPTLSNIPSSLLSLTDSCTCNTCDCYIPPQSQDLLYDMDLIRATSGVATWFIGVYNFPTQAAPIYSTVPQVSSGMQLRVRYKSGLTSSLCPMDCSGNGQCSYPSGLATNAQFPSTYMCYCNNGYGGPYCQGKMQTIKVTESSGNFDTGSVTMAPGQWTYFNINVLSTSVASLAWTPDTSPSPNQLFAISPIYTLSVGEQYFLPSTTWVFMSWVSGLQLPSTGALNGWILGVYNSDAQVQLTSSFSIVINGSSKNLNFLSTLQMALIGAASGLIMLTLAFMTIRLILLRRTAVRTFPEILPPEQQMVRLQPVGVPEDVVASFPLFKFNAHTFEETKKQMRERLRAPPPAPAPAAVPRPDPAAAPPVPAAPKPTAWQDGTSGTSHHESGSEAEDDAPQCSVCICDFEEGEVLRQLPCAHIFHQGCIDPWMLLHNTCPNCRWALSPDAPPQEARRNRRRVRNQIAPTPSPELRSPSSSTAGQLPTLPDGSVPMLAVPPHTPNHAVQVQSRPVSVGWGSASPRHDASLHAVTVPAVGDVEPPHAGQRQ